MNNTHIQLSNIHSAWYLIDAKKQNLGRLSTHIAKLLQGKNNSTYIPYINPKIYIIVTNAKYIHITGQKKHQKIYKRHSGRPGGLKTETFKELNQRMPNRIVENCIKGMLPKNKLSKRLIKQLKVYTDDHHPYTTQKPKIIILN